MVMTQSNTHRHEQLQGHSPLGYEVRLVLGGGEWELQIGADEGILCMLDLHSRHYPQVIFLHSSPVNERMLTTLRGSANTLAH